MLEHGKTSSNTGNTSNTGNRSNQAGAATPGKTALTDGLHGAPTTPQDPAKGNDPQAIITHVEGLPAAQQAAYLKGLPPGKLSWLAAHLKGVKVQNATLHVIFDTIPDTDVASLEAVMTRRYHVSLVATPAQKKALGIGENWTAPALRRLWVILSTLPPDQVQNNKDLALLLRDSKTDGAGFYEATNKASVVGYSGLDKKGSYGSIDVSDGKGGTKDVGLHSNVNLFTTVVRHEIGHAVDAKIGASKPGGYVRTAKNAGVWKGYNTSKDWVDAIVTAGGGMKGHGYANETVYRHAMDKAVAEKKDFAIAVHEIDPKIAAPTGSVTGPVAALVTTDLWDPDQSPWYQKPDRQAVGGRLWQRPYDFGEYVSFEKSARADHGVSGYQFRAPGEWFAEAYSVYYSDDDSVGKKPGTTLRTRDAAAADWFDKHVDKGYSLKHQTNQTGGGAGGHDVPTGGGAGTAVADASHDAKGTA